MLDMLFLVEWTWCAVLISARGVQLAVLCSGGLIASAYVASQLSGWMTRSFTPQGSVAFLWLQGHVSSAPGVISALSGFAPVTTVTTGGIHLHQAVALHILHTMFYIAITTAVFLLFVMVWHFSRAVWDRTTNAAPRRDVASVLLSTMCGGILIAFTGIFIGNIAWLREVPLLAHAVEHSIGMSYIAQVVRILNVL